MSCQQVPTTPAFNLYPRSVQVGEFEVAIDGGIWVAIRGWDGQGLCLFAKRLEKGRFVWPQADSGAVSLTPAQLSMLLEGIDWRMPTRTWQPQRAA